MLPAGLVGLIPSVKLCAEPQRPPAAARRASQIGTATAAAGVGSEPFSFSGPVYLTGPTNGAPYGLSIPIEAAAGPFDLGRVADAGGDRRRRPQRPGDRDGHAAAIVDGVPLRLRSLSVAVNEGQLPVQPDLLRPAVDRLDDRRDPGRARAPVEPVRRDRRARASPSSRPSRPRARANPRARNGAACVVTFTQPAHQANIRSVVASLPKQLPSRLTTLQKACTEGVWAGGNGYKSCPAGSKVGSATVTTPVLPEKLTGPAYLVSHGGAAFPDLDLILEGDHGVKVILEGNTNIKNGVTTSTFASMPDVPVSNFELSLPTGPNSALGNVGGLCSKPLFMPTTITAQNGKVIKQNTRLSIGSCKIKLISKKVRRHKLILKAQVFTAGRVSVTSRRAAHDLQEGRADRRSSRSRCRCPRKASATLASGRRLPSRSASASTRCTRANTTRPPSRR